MWRSDRHTHLSRAAGGCQATTNAGDRCKAPALKGGDLCSAHSGIVKLDPHKAARRSAEVRRAKAEARRETVRDKLARKLEEHADDVVAAYLNGIRSDDPHQAYKAAEAWLSRVFGRPTQTVETASSDEPIGAAMSSEERRRLIREIAAQHPDIARRVGIKLDRL